MSLPAAWIRWFSLACGLASTGRRRPQGERSSSESAAAYCLQLREAGPPRLEERLRLPDRDPEPHRESVRLHAVHRREVHGLGDVALPRRRFPVEERACDLEVWVACLDHRAQRIVAREPGRHAELHRPVVDRPDHRTGVGDEHAAYGEPALEVVAELDRLRRRLQRHTADRHPTRDRGAGARVGVQAPVLLERSREHPRVQRSELAGRPQREDVARDVRAGGRERREHRTVELAVRDLQPLALERGDDRRPAGVGGNPLDALRGECLPSRSSAAPRRASSSAAASGSTANPRRPARRQIAATRCSSSSSRSEPASARSRS